MNETIEQVKETEETQALPAIYPFRKIRGVMAEQDVNQETLRKLSKLANQTLSDVLAGKPTVQADSIAKALAPLGYRLTIEPIPGHPAHEQASY